MTKKLMPIFIFLGTVSAFAQTYDLAGQLRVIKDLMPGSARMGMLYDPTTPNIDALITNASQDTGIAVVKAPVKTARDMTNALRSLAKYDVDFIFLIEDKTVTGPQSIKFVVRQTMRKKIPVFTVSANAFKGGAFGWVVENGAAWRIKINGSVRDRFDISIPEDGKFIIE